MKFGGLGLKNMVVVSLFTIIMIIMLKVIFTKYQVKGVTELVTSI